MRSRKSLITVGSIWWDSCSNSVESNVSFMAGQYTLTCYHFRGNLPIDPQTFLRVSPDAYH